MSDPYGPASHLGRRHDRRMTSAGERPYPEIEAARTPELALAAVRALVQAEDSATVRQVVATVVGDLGGALVPARLEPQDALPGDVSLGLGEPVLVVVDPLSVAALRLREVMPALLDDARTVLARLSRQREPCGQRAERGADDAHPADVDGYLAHVSVGDADAARRFVLGLLDRGVSSASIAEDVLAPAQREVGERWYRGTWSVADEHAATAIAELCLNELPRPQEGPRVVIAAPEGEWHTLPSRLAAAAARDVRARALGPGLPAEHLQRYLELRGADLLAVSCTMATNLLAAARSIRAAAAAGVPVVAGGRAFGPDGSRARRLGADGWLGSAGELGSFVPVRQQDVPPVPHEAVVADAVADEVLVMALERQAAAAPWVRAMDERQRRHSIDDLRWITRHAAAAHACDDPSLLDDLLGWLDVLLRDRGVPGRVLPDGTAYLADVLEPQTPAVADLLRGAEVRLR